MVYQLILQKSGIAVEHGITRGEKDVGENIFLYNLPNEYPCYAFYYPGPTPEPELEQALRKFGDQTGKNLFVNIGRLNDPDYGKIANLFDIKRNPVIVLTAIKPFAAPVDSNLSTYVRLDTPKMLASTKRTMQCVQEVFNLFQRGKVAEAIAKGKWKERSELLLIVGDFIHNALKSLGEFITTRDLSVSLFEGSFELKRSKE